jgi:hypothetical protein
MYQSARRIEEREEEQQQQEEHAPAESYTVVLLY